MYSDRSHLSTLGVNTCQTIHAKGFDTEVRHGPNQHLFQVAHVAMNVFTIGAEIDDGITYHLAQPVISDFSTTIGFEERYVACFELLSIQQDLMNCRRAARSSGCAGVRVTEKGLYG